MICSFLVTQTFKLDEKMRKIKGPAEAEAKAREFIKERHSRVRQILFRRVNKEGDAWLLDGEVLFKWAYFFTAKRSFRLQMNPETGEVASYEETRHSPI